MYTKFQKHKGITFGFTTPVSVGSSVIITILEVSSSQSKENHDYPINESGKPIEPYLKEVVPIVTRLIEPEINKIKELTKNQNLSFQWIYFDLNGKPHPIET